ncbi:MAG: hypothetical protein IJJ13_02025 [Lachnospiraceae bacterium]|nr:hypothetical protein [Lachnospiraceae bacterium]
MKKSVLAVIAILEAVTIVIGLIYISVLSKQKTPMPGTTAGVVQETAEDIRAQLEAVAGETEAKAVAIGTEKDTELNDQDVQNTGVRLDNKTGVEKGTSYEDLTIIGDSISRMTKEQVEEALPGVEIHSMYGKTVDYSIETNPCGLELAKLLELEGRLRDRVIFALGTNNVAALSMNTLTPEMFAKLHEITGDREVYLVTAYDLYDPAVYDENNRVIREAAEKYDGWHVIDWAKAVAAEDPKKIIEDEGEAATGNCQVHPTDPAGIALWVKTISEGVK